MSKDLIKQKLIEEIDTVLERNDVNQKDFVILQSLKYLLMNGCFPITESVIPIDEWNYSEGKK